jgi:outer membrane protein OmpA-like peptidoglycan-associated protein
MKRFIICLSLVGVLGLSNHLQAQFKASGAAYGFSVGASQGTNNAGDIWGLQYRGFIQGEFIPAVLIGQFGVGFTELNSPNVYSVQTGMADLRLLFSPLSVSNLRPHLYAGVGLSKALNKDGSDYLLLVPFGLGIQTRIFNQVLLSVSGGYNLSLSDQLDGRARTNTDLNPLTNGKQDGFYDISVGLAFTLGHGYDEAAELKKKELADAEARRVKQQADADAEARRVKEATDAEARRVKELNDAEARRLKQQADADAQARRVKDSTDAVARSVKEATDAEARRVKELADAEARRVAAQKPIIILEKGKKVVLKGVTFETGKAILRKESEPILTLAYNALVANPNIQVEISGHSDNVGSPKVNQSLSLKRAQAVRNWLVQKGIVSTRMKAVGKGQNEPVASNDTDAGRAENRRIEFYVQQ